ncbi:MAG TPA: hypothetical protein VK509_19155 [Polyangiales bacterium]|nr:hypothetical protein [Polyangiales bacterium]
MSRESEQLLDLVREAEDPTAEDEARVYGALQAAIAVGAAPGVVVDGSLASSGWKVLLAKVFAAKLQLGVLALSSSALLAIAYVATRPPQPGAHEPTQAPAHSSAPLSPPLPATTPRATTADHDAAAPVATPAEARRRSGQRPARSLRAELALLQRVQAALKRGDGATALRELDAHPSADREWLAERRALRILALCSVGRVAEARAAAVVFAERHPDSVQREAIARSCANAKRIAEP